LHVFKEVHHILGNTATKANVCLAAKRCSAEPTLESSLAVPWSAKSGSAECTALSH
jgi:hypothetical protein